MKQLNGFMLGALIALIGAVVYGMVKFGIIIIMIVYGAFYY